MMLSASTVIETELIEWKCPASDCEFDNTDDMIAGYDGPLTCGSCEREFEQSEIADLSRE